MVRCTHSSSFNVNLLVATCASAISACPRNVREHRAVHGDTIHKKAIGLNLAGSDCPPNSLMYLLAYSPHRNLHGLVGQALLHMPTMQEHAYHAHNAGALQPCKRAPSCSSSGARRNSTTSCCAGFKPRALLQLALHYSLLPPLSNCASSQHHPTHHSATPLASLNEF
jgi:hypothetical protein